MTTENPHSPHQSLAASARLKKRHGANKRLKWYGILAIGFAALALVTLLSSVFIKAVGALKQDYALFEMTIPASEVDPDGTGDPAIMRRGDFGGIVKDVLKADFPGASGRSARRELYGLISDGAADDMRNEAEAGTIVLDEPQQRPFLLSDDASLYLKGYYGALEPQTAAGTITPDGTEKDIRLESTAPDFAVALAAVKRGLEREAAQIMAKAARQQRGADVTREQLAGLTGEEAEKLQKRIDGYAAQAAALTAKADALLVRARATGGEEKLSDEDPSFFVQINGGWVKAETVSETAITGAVITPLTSTDAAKSGDWAQMMMDRPESGRKISDRQIIWIETLKEQGRIETVWNKAFFTNSDSREAELAGVKGALKGTLLTMLVTFVLSFPVGVLAAIYLEEFAPKNRFTDFIEVNINNLAAVPSIVFGLLGLAVFLNFFGVPRSAPLAGGLVLALMTLPTIIIASRAALRAVPPSIRDAALGLGASRVQAVFHHVLPLAMPGILTGTIIGMAQALGETAPLIMIGMIGFFAEVPGFVTDPATVMPGLIFSWADHPEKLFEMKTSLAIVVLLAFLVTMNALAVLLRKRFERRW